MLSLLELVDGRSGDCLLKLLHLPRLRGRGPARGPCGLGLKLRRSELLVQFCLLGLELLLQVAFALLRLSALLLEDGVVVSDSLRREQLLVEFGLLFHLFSGRRSLKARPVGFKLGIAHFCVCLKARFPRSKRGFLLRSFRPQRLLGRRCIRL